MKLDYSFDESLKSKFVKEIQSYWKNSRSYINFIQTTQALDQKVQRKGEKMRDFSIMTQSNDHGIEGLNNTTGY